MGNNNEEMRKMLKEMSDYPYDVFDYGCTSFGEAAAWALKTIDAQQAEIERLQPKKGHWEMKEDPLGFWDEIPVCSECGCTNTLRKKAAFCEHCGADMREGDGDG